MAGSTRHGENYSPSILSSGCDSQPAAAHTVAILGCDLARLRRARK